MSKSNSAETLRLIEKEQMRYRWVSLLKLTVCLTNKCNLNCEFCLSRDRDESKEIPFSHLVKAIKDAKLQGCKSLSLTGGGEPFLYGRINDSIRVAKIYGMKVHCVTNGTLLQKLSEPIDGCTISYGTGRKLTKNFRDTLYTTTKRYSGTNWVLRYVVYKNNYDNMKELIEFLNEISLSEIIIISDIFEPKPFDEELKTITKQSKHRIRLEIPPLNPPCGSKGCMVSLLLPVVSAEEKIFPCCMVQFAKDNIPKDHPKDMSMGKLSDLNKIWSNQIRFDGSRCDKCYLYDFKRISPFLDRLRINSGSSQLDRKNFFKKSLTTVRICL